MLVQFESGALDVAKGSLRRTSRASKKDPAYQTITNPVSGNYFLFG